MPELSTIVAQTVRGIQSEFYRDELFARNGNVGTHIIVPFAAGMSHARPVRAKCKSGGFTHGWARG